MQNRIVYPLIGPKVPDVQKSVAPGDAYAGSARIPGGTEALRQVQHAVDRRLQGRSSWLRAVRQRLGETP